VTQVSLSLPRGNCGGLLGSYDLSSLGLLCSPSFPRSVMSQPSSGSSSPAPSNFALLQYAQARRRVLDMRGSLAEVQYKDAARRWILGFIEATVSDCFSSCAHLGNADSAQDALSALGPSTGHSAEADSDVRGHCGKTPMKIQFS
jgi:hypothetical protein